MLNLPLAVAMCASSAVTVPNPGDTMCYIGDRTPATGVCAGIAMPYRHCRSSAAAGHVAELGYVAAFDLMTESSVHVGTDGAGFGVCQAVAVTECAAAAVLDGNGGALTASTGVDSCAYLCNGHYAVASCDTGTTATLLSLSAPTVVVCLLVSRVLFCFQERMRLMPASGSPCNCEVTVSFEWMGRCRLPHWDCRSHLLRRNLPPSHLAPLRHPSWDVSRFSVCVRTQVLKRSCFWRQVCEDNMKKMCTGSNDLGIERVTFHPPVAAHPALFA